MRMPRVRGSDSSLHATLLLHPHTLVMWSAEEESCHQSVPGPSEQGRSTGGSSHWPTFSLSQHLKVSSRSARTQWRRAAGRRDSVDSPSRRFRLLRVSHQFGEKTWISMGQMLPLLLLLLLLLVLLVGTGSVHQQCGWTKPNNFNHRPCSPNQQESKWSVAQCSAPHSPGGEANICRSANSTH